MCDCIKTINQKLKDAGYNTIINSPITFDGGTGKTMVETTKADISVRQKPIKVFASFCPFCGKKYE